MFNIKPCIIGCLIVSLVLFSFSLSFASNKDEDEWIAKDKALHLTLSFAIDTFAYNFYKKNTNWTDTQVKTASILTTLTAGFAKEFYDDRFSWKDISADAIGTAIGAIVSLEF